MFVSVSVGCFLSMSSFDPRPHFIREVEARPVKEAIVYVFQRTLKVFNQIIIRACSIKHRCDLPNSGQTLYVITVQFNSVE